MNYPFNTGDLLCCGQCAANYLDNSVKVCLRVRVHACMRVWLFGGPRGHNL